MWLLAVVAKWNFNNALSYFVRDLILTIIFVEQRGDWIFPKDDVMAANSIMKVLTDNSRAIVVQ